MATTILYALLPYDRKNSRYYDPENNVIKSNNPFALLNNDGMRPMNFAKKIS